MRAPSRLAVWFLVAGCQASPATCPFPADAGDGAGLDAQTQMDAGAWSNDAGLCDPPRTAQVLLHRIWRAESPSVATVCPASNYRMRIFPRGATAPVFDAMLGGSCGGATGAIAPGEYDLVVEALDDPRWIAGAALVRAGECVPGAEPTPAYCEPVHFTLAPCDHLPIFAVLYCDPNDPSMPCPPGDWP